MWNHQSVEILQHTGFNDARKKIIVLCVFFHLVLGKIKMQMKLRLCISKLQRHFCSMSRIMTQKKSHYAIHLWYCHSARTLIVRFKMKLARNIFGASDKMSNHEQPIDHFKFTQSTRWTWNAITSPTYISNADTFTLSPWIFTRASAFTLHFNF